MKSLSEHYKLLLECWHCQSDTNNFSFQEFFRFLSLFFISDPLEGGRKKEKKERWKEGRKERRKDRQGKNSLGSVAKIHNQFFCCLGFMAIYM